MIQVETKRMVTSAIDAFKQAMSATGVEPPAEIVADGELHRFTVSGDRARSDNGWFVFHSDDPAAGAFGCWKRGISEMWCSKTSQSMTQAERSAYMAKMEAVKQKREEELKRIQTECRVWCADAWDKAEAASNEHDYLRRKGVQAYGLKSFNEKLLVPIQDMEGTIHGLQFIAPDGNKKFKTGTSKVGHFFRIGEVKNNIVILCEGYATGASIHQATGHAVFVAFDAGNLLAVAQIIRLNFPEMTIIVAADDDHGTDGNPGLTKATEAAQAVNGFLAIPVFPDNRESNDTDFNDLARRAGLEDVRNCIEAATKASIMPAGDNDNRTNSHDHVIQKLAALPLLEYDQVRKAEAKMMGVRTTTLDFYVKQARKGVDAGELPFTEVEPWPESVDPAILLTDISKTIRLFIVCDEEVANAVALWVAMTWLIDEVQVAPLAVITAPEKRCGKSLLLSLLGKLSARAITASSITPAALYRTIEAWQPTLLIDEADAFMRDNEELRGLINSGHTRDSAYVIRTVGENFTPTKFSTWGAKALAGIGHLADTLMDRAVILELRRKLPHEKVWRIRDAEPGLFEDLRAKLTRFADDYSDRVRQARPPLPNSLNDRAQDNWEPLLAIAMTASDEWLQLGTKAALKLSGSESSSQTIGTELLSDIQGIFEEQQVDRISTSELIKALCADDEKPWMTYNKGFPIKPRQLANKLKSYGIQSKTIRFGTATAKGYEYEQFREAFSRYIPSPPLPCVTTSQPAPVKDLMDYQSVTELPGVTLRNRHNSSITKECYSVTHENTEKGHEGIKNLRDLSL